MMIDPYTLSETLSIARRELGYTQQQLANAIGVSRHTILAFEKGDISSISFGTVCKIAQKLGYEFILERGITLPTASDTKRPANDKISRIS